MIAPLPRSFLVVVLAFPLTAVALVVCGCASSADRAPRGDASGNTSGAEPIGLRPPMEEGGVEAVITATVDPDQQSPDGRVGSFELGLTFSHDEVLLFQFESRVPEPLSLEFDPSQFASGRIRILAVNTTEDVRDGPVGSFEVARLSFAPAPPRTLTELREALSNGEINCRIIARAYGLMPEQKPIKVRFDIKFYWAVRRLE